jgi:hypothetical protein
MKEEFLDNKVRLERIVGGGTSWFYPVDQETGEVYWFLGFHEDDQANKQLCLNILKEDGLMV